MRTITVTLSIPFYASTYADLTGPALLAAVTAWGRYLEDRLTAAGYEVEVEATWEALIEDRIDTDGDADEVRDAMARIGDDWFRLSADGRAEYGFPGDDAPSPASATLSLSRLILAELLYRVDEEYAAEDWWTAARAAEDCPPELYDLVYGRATEARAPLVTLAWCRSLPGWATGPDHARHPLTWRAL